MRVLLPLLAVAVVYAADARATTTALVPVGGAASPSEREAFDAELRDAIVARRAATLQDAAATAEAIAASIALEGACDVATASCLGRIAATGVVDQAIGGTLDAPVGGVHQVRLDLVSADGARLRSVTAAVPALGTARGAAFIPLVVKLLQPERDGALLRVTSRTGANVIIDGRPVGTAPFGPRNVGAGTHRVETVAPGFENGERVITLTYGDEVTLDVPLGSYTGTGAPPPLPPAPTPEPEVTSRATATVAVVTIENDGDDPRIAAWFVDAVAREAAKRHGITLLDRSTPPRILENIWPEWLADTDACGAPPPARDDAAASPARAAEARDACVLERAAALNVDIFIDLTLRVRDGVRVASIRSHYLDGSRLVSGAESRPMPAGRSVLLADEVATLVASALEDFEPIPGLVAGPDAVQRYTLDPPPLHAGVFVGTAAIAGVSLLAAGGLGAVALSGAVPEEPARTAVAVTALGAAGGALGAGALLFVLSPYTDWGPPAAP